MTLKLTDEEWVDLLELVKTQGEFTTEAEQEYWRNLNLKLRTYSEENLNIPLVVRLAGTNFKEGKVVLDQSGLKILSATDLNDAAKKIIKAIK